MSSHWTKFLESAPLSPRTQITEENSVDVLVDSGEFLPAMVNSIDAAEKSVAFQFYGMEADAGGLPFAGALHRACKRGVDVRMILDSVEMFLQTNGKWSFHPFRSREVGKERRETKRMLKNLEKSGARLYRYGWKYGLYRNHSKSLIIDETQAFIGGFNPTEHNAKWHDVCAWISGDGVSCALNKFDDVFPKRGIEFVPQPKRGRIQNGYPAKAAWISNEPLKGHFGIRSFFKHAFRHAKRSILIENAYLADAELVGELVKAKKRGLAEVVIIAPKKSNHPYVDARFQKNMQEVVEAGVEVYLYPEMTHAKVIMIDDELLSIGSANFNRFGLRFHNEMNLVALDEEGSLAYKLRAKVFDTDMARSEKIMPRSIVKVTEGNGLRRPGTFTDTAELSDQVSKTKTASA